MMMMRAKMNPYLSLWWGNIFRRWQRLLLWRNSWSSSLFYFLKKKKTILTISFCSDENKCSVRAREHSPHIGVNLQPVWLEAAALSPGLSVTPGCQMLYFPGVRLEVSGVSLCRSVAVRAVPSRTTEPAGWVTTAQRRIRWPRWHRWPRSGEAPSPLRSYSGSLRLLLSVPVRGSLSALGSTSRRAANANCGPMSGVPTCRLCWLREHTTAAAWGGWRRGVGGRKLCQAACSQ